ncbi:alpha-methylacyl-CoA racemase [Microdochium nivale]|nr:alpha-methylacyl-CoA racemase [Microdochium nivale]
MIESKQGISWGVLFATLVPATVCFAMRMQSRHLTKVHLWWDDYMAIAGYFCSIAWLVMVPIWIQYGLGMHIQDVKGYTIDELLFANKLILYIAEFFYAFSLYFAKTSILCFYWRVFGVSASMKLAIKILLGCALIWIIIRTFLGIFHCIPVQAYWDSSAGGFCAVEDTKFFFGSILVHVVMDIAIILLPVLPIKHLSLPTRQRIAIAVVFMFGFFICFAGVMIIIESTRFDAGSIDLTWNIEPIVTWATVEVNMVVVSTSLPALRPSLLWIVGRSSHSNNSSGPGLSGSHNGGRKHSRARCCPQDSRGIMLSSKGVGSSPFQGHHHHEECNTNKSYNKMRSKHRNSDHVGDDDSTYELADSVRGGGDDSSADFDNHALDSRDAGFRTVINAGGGGGSGGDGEQRHDAAAGPVVMFRRGSEARLRPLVGVADGIVVQSETSVMIEERRKN